MKNSLLIAAVAMMAVPAMASKARLTALNNAAHLEDIQQTFDNASKVNLHGDWLSFEMGATHSANQASAAATTPLGPYNNDAANAEGGFVRGMGDAHYGFYLGHHSNWVAEVRQPQSYVTGKTYLTDENPVDLFYGSKMNDMNWGVGLHYANSDKKSTKAKQSALGLNAGVSASNWEAALNLGLTNTYKKDVVATGATDVDFKGSTAIGLNGKYKMDTMTYFATANMNGGKDDNNNVDMTQNHYIIGVENSHKAEGVDFFYGASYDMFTVKNKASSGDKKYDASQLPVFAGLEADATSWMVLRASVTQNFLLGTVKDEFNSTGDADTVSNNTVVAAGMGLKFNKLLLDGTLSKASGSSATGDINGNNFLANASVTYMF